MLTAEHSTEAFQEGTDPGQILHVGDIALVGYKLTKLLRKHHVAADYLGYAKPWIRSERQPWVREFTSNPSLRTNKISVAFQTIGAVERYRVVHAHSIFAIPLLLKSIDFLLHLHGSDLRVYAWQKTPLGWATRRAIHRARSILVSTPDLLPVIARFGRSAVFLPNPVDFDVFRERQSDVNFHDGVDWVIFHPASHSADKRNEVLLKAVRHLVDEGRSLRLVTIEWGSLVGASRRLVEKLDLGKYVRWIPMVQPDRMADYYNMSDVVCDQFGLNIIGMTTLEAMACSKPVVTCHTTTGEKRGYQSEPPLPAVEDESDVADVIDHMLSSRDYRRELGRTGAAWVSKEHSENLILGKLVDEYEAIAPGVIRNG